MWTDDEMQSGFDTAQICTNGHVINRNYQRYPQHNQDFCDICGSPTITTCTQCTSPIRGMEMSTTIWGGGNGREGSTAPDFCYGCGEAYPWTKARLEAAKDFADLIDGISEDEREKLKQGLSDLVKDSPRTGVAAVRWKINLARAGKLVADGFKEVMYSIAVEAAKKSIWG